MKATMTTTMSPEAAASAAYAKTCTPTCKWSCDNPHCEQNCQPTCAAPVCKTYCKPIERGSCHTTCTDPSCTVICPQSCTKGNCPQCRTVCGPPKCNTDCNQECEAKCADPMCTWHCTKPQSCPKPTCRLDCGEAQRCAAARNAVRTGSIPKPSDGFTVNAGDNFVASLGHVENMLDAETSMVVGGDLGNVENVGPGLMVGGPEAGYHCLFHPPTSGAYLMRGQAGVEGPSGDSEKVETIRQCMESCCKTGTCQSFDIDTKEGNCYPNSDKSRVGGGHSDVVTGKEVWIYYFELAWRKNGQ